MQSHAAGREPVRREGEKEREMSRKNLTRRTRLIRALGLVAALALPSAALARPARQTAAPWGPVWSWLVSWVTGIDGAPAAPASRRPSSISREKAGATLD